MVISIVQTYKDRRVARLDIPGTFLTGRRPESVPNRRDGNSGSRSGVLDCLISSNVALPPSESSRHKPSTSILLPTPTHQLIPPTAFPFLVRINIALTALRTARRIPTFPDLLTPDFSPGPGVADGGLKQCPRLSISKIPIPVTYGQAKALQ